MGNNDLNPTWNHQVTFDYEENAPTIDIDVFDEDTMAKDNSLGRLSIDVAEIKRNKAVTDAEASFEESSSGSIKYSAEFVTSFTSLSTKQKTSTSHQVESMQSDIGAAKAKQEEEAKLKAKAEADKAKQEEEAKQKAEAEKAKQEEEARLKAEAEATKAKQEEEARLKFEAEAAKAKEEEEARLIAHAEAAKAKQENKQKAEQVTAREESQLEAASIGDESSTLNINVLVVGARNLEKSGMFGKADPYIVVSHKDKKKTSATINNDLNPQWNFENTFVVNKSSKETLRFEVYDKDMVTKDDLMGTAEISITDAAQMKEGLWIPLQGCKSGELFVSVEIFQPKTGEEDSLKSEDTEIQEKEARLKAEAEAVKAKQEEEARMKAEAEAAKAKQEEE